MLRLQNYTETCTVTSHTTLRHSPNLPPCAAVTIPWSIGNNSSRRVSNSSRRNYFAPPTRGRINRCVPRKVKISAVGMMHFTLLENADSTANTYDGTLAFGATVMTVAAAAASPVAYRRSSLSSIVSTSDTIRGSGYNNVKCSKSCHVKYGIRFPASSASKTGSGYGRGSRKAC